MRRPWPPGFRQSRGIVAIHRRLRRLPSVMHRVTSEAAPEVRAGSVTVLALLFGPHSTNLPLVLVTSSFGLPYIRLSRRGSRRPRANLDSCLRSMRSPRTPHIGIASANLGLGACPMPFVRALVAQGRRVAAMERQPDRGGFACSAAVCHHLPKLHEGGRALAKRWSIVSGVMGSASDREARSRLAER